MRPCPDTAHHCGYLPSFKSLYIFKACTKYFPSICKIELWFEYEMFAQVHMLTVTSPQLVVLCGKILETLRAGTQPEEVGRH